jgi:hypothetical protein
MLKKRRGILIIGAVFLVLAVSLIIILSGSPRTDMVIEQDGIATRSLHQDPYEYHKNLEAFLFELKKGRMTNQEIVEIIELIKRDLEEIGSYYEILPAAMAGNAGALFEEGNPIGGGKGYKDIKRTGKYSVRTAAQLVKAVNSAKEGDVIFVHKDAKIDLTDYMIAQNYTIRLKDGVTLASDRGKDGSEGGVIYTNAIVDRPMIDAGSNVRITGLVIQGPDSKRRDLEDMKAGVGIFSDGSFVTIDNCEISGFGEAAIELKNGENHLVSNNYIHHNRNIGKGYGIRVINAKVRIENNLFNRNNISIYGDGGDRCSLEIVNNVEMGENYEACVMMGSLSSNGSLRTGETLIIQNNTYMTEQNPFNILGLPKTKLEIKDNYFAKSEGQYDKKKLYGEKNEYKEFYTGNEFSLLKKAGVKEQKLPFTYSVEMNRTGVTNRVFYGDLEVSQAYLKNLQDILIEEEKTDLETVKQEVEKALMEIECYDRYYEFIGRTYFEVNGEIYGAVPKGNNPLGGGYGYEEIFTTGDYVVETKDQLLEALAIAKSGEVIFIKGDAVIDLTAIKETIKVNDGITIASDRGNNGSTGALVFSDSFVTPLFQAGKDVRFTGITFKGADPERRIEFHSRTLIGSEALGRDVYYRLPALDCILTDKDNLTVDNCEFSGFSHAAIFIRQGNNHHFHHNFFHHNQRQGLGYGICLDVSTAVIEYNLMNANRHDIAGTGRPKSGYYASNNVQMGISLSHCFDMHGGSDRGDGTDIAGEYVIMFNNLFLSNEYPYYLRGTPTDTQEFYNNALYNALGFWQKGPLYGSGERQKYIHVYNNLFNIKGENATVVK